MTTQPTCPPPIELEEVHRLRIELPARGDDHLVRIVRGREGLAIDVQVAGATAEPRRLVSKLVQLRQAPVGAPSLATLIYRHEAWYGIGFVIASAVAVLVATLRVNSSQQHLEHRILTAQVAA